MPKALLTIPLLSSTCALAANITITGRVYSIDGIPQGGVNVLLKGTPVGTATDMSGYFSLDAPEGKAVLIFSFLRRKAVEHVIITRQGFQYQVSVALSRKTQTFNKSIATTAILPADAGIIHGRVMDDESSALSGVSIVQSNNGFKTISDTNGNFVLPVADGNFVIIFRRPGSKDLDLELRSDRGESHNLEVILTKDSARLLHSRARQFQP